MKMNKVINMKSQISIQNFIQFWIFNITLCVTVFAFSGYHSPNPSEVQESTKTELLESRVHQANYILEWDIKEVNKKASNPPESASSVYDYQTLINFSVALKAKIKSYQQSVLRRQINSEITVIKIPSSSTEDDDPNLLYS